MQKHGQEISHLQEGEIIKTSNKTNVLNTFARVINPP